MGSSPARDSNTPGGVSLHAHALTGTSARLAELSLIAAMATIVLLVHHSAGASADPWLSLHVPLLALALGALGALTAGPDAVGLPRSRRYPIVYTLGVAVMIAVDLGVRAALGGDLPIVFSNWAALIGSASAINLLATRVPVLGGARWVDEREVSTLHPALAALAVIVQVLQLAISVIGAPWPTIFAQLLARRVAILPMTHLIARAHYGAGAAARLRAHRTFEYIATRSMTDAQRRVLEPEPRDQVVVGALLLRLPMFAGEPMNAGRHSLARLGDKLVFLEQMLAFSSPTFVVSRPVALGHIAFIQELLRLGASGEAAALPEREQCKRHVAAAMCDDWSSFR